MIQRIQTLWLLIVVVLAVLLFFYPATESYPCLLSGASASAALLAFITIFLYKKRKVQIGLSYVLFILLLAYLVFVFVITDVADYSWYLLIPFVATDFPILAIQAIKKDEQLVRSLDRLR
jgi:hypothetical protein